MPSAKVNGTELHYEIQGDGPPVLFMHGLGSSTRDWSGQVAALKDHYQCIVYDARGHGKSAKPPGPYSVSQHAADAAALLDHLSIPKVVVVGLSMGGMIAFQMAVDTPEYLNAMVIINSRPRVKPINFQERKALWQRMLITRLFSMRRIGEVLSQRLFPAPDQAALREDFAARWAENDKRAYVEATKALLSWTVMDRIASIQTPTLVIASDLDYTPVSLKQAYVDQMPHAELVVVENAHHAITSEKPEAVNALLGDYLARTLQPEAAAMG